VAWRKARFEGLMQHEPYRALFARLLMAPPARELAPQAARRLHHYASKARHASKHSPS
jgi:hypothetical protein